MPRGGRNGEAAQASTDSVLHYAPLGLRHHDGRQATPEDVAARYREVCADNLACLVRLCELERSECSDQFKHQGGNKATRLSNAMAHTWDTLETLVSFVVHVEDADRERVEHRLQVRA